MFPAQAYNRNIASEPRSYTCGSAATYTHGQCLRTNNGRAVAPASTALAGFIGVYAGATGTLAVGDSMKIWDDPNLVYECRMDTGTVLTDTAGAGNGVFTDGHEADEGCLFVFLTGDNAGKVGIVKSISAGTSFVVRKPSSATAYYSAAVGDTGIVIPGIGYKAECDSTYTMCDGTVKDDGVLLVVDLSEPLRRALTGSNISVDTSDTRKWAKIYVSIASVHRHIAGGQAAA